MGQFYQRMAPPVEGKYMVVAEFSGSAAYGKSSASTYFTVDKAPTAVQQMEPELAAPATAITTDIAIIVAAVIVAVALLAGLWIVRKRK
jgi:hypothetical protein